MQNPQAQIPCSLKPSPFLMVNISMLVNHDITLRELQIRKFIPNASSIEIQTVSQSATPQLE